MNAATGTEKGQAGTLCLQAKAKRPGLLNEGGGPSGFEPEMEVLQPEEVLRRKSKKGS